MTCALRLRLRLRCAATPSRPPTNKECYYITSSPNLGGPSVRLRKSMKMASKSPGTILLLLPVLLVVVVVSCLSGCQARISSGGCSPGFVWVEKPEGGRCMRDFRRQWKRRLPWSPLLPPTTTTTTTTTTARPFGFASRRPSPTDGGGQHFGFSPKRRGPERPGEFASRPTTSWPDPDHFFAPPRVGHGHGDHNDVDNRWEQDKKNGFDFGGGPRLVVPAPSPPPASAPLPDPNGSLASDDVRCLQEEKVLWRRDGRCHLLLHRGPCGDGEWLVLRRSAASPGNVSVVCEERPCPCSTAEPMLCEVLYDDGGVVDERGCGGGRRCRVSLAAEQVLPVAAGKLVFNYPTNIGTTRATPTAMPLVVISDRRRNLGCSRLLQGFFFHILTPALVLGQPITKCTLTILVGYSRLCYSSNLIVANCHIS